MPVKLQSLKELSGLAFDDVIDVRSPAEYAEDHIPGALNLAALSNEERARIGTIYVQQDRFLARKTGAALVARNVAAHLDGPLSDRDGGWRPLIYCWRGGQRSGSVATILKQVGWRADVIEGGYRAYRRLVVDALYNDPFPSRIVLIDGGTGTAKTRLLHHLAARGAQVIDLEDMANHRGSVFGPLSTTQPSQKKFESVLAAQVTALDPARPVYVEAESTRIGQINLPPSLCAAMHAGRRIMIRAPIDARVAYLLSAYADLTAEPKALDRLLQKLVRYHGHDVVNGWRSLAANGDLSTLAEALVVQHYDPRYARMSHGETGLELDLPDLSEGALDETARKLIAIEGA